MPVTLMCNRRREHAQRRQAEELGRALMPAVKVYRRWCRLTDTYLAARSTREEVVLRFLAGGRRNAAARLLRAVTEGGDATAY